MNFETDKMLRNVLEFYQSSGLLPSGTEPVEIDTNACFSADGNRGQMEQVLFFVFGHLLPEFIPRKITCCRLPGTAGAMETLGIRLDFTGVTVISMQEMFQSLMDDPRLKRMIASNNSSLELTVDKESGTKSLELHFPVAVILAEPANVVIDFQELEKRYDGLELAITLLDGFVMNASRHISLMRSAMEHGDWKEAHRHAHALKGGALNVCADNLARKAKNVELLIKDGHYTDVADQIDQLERACAELEETWFKHQEELNG